jgi:hypothetical protein
MKKIFLTLSFSLALLSTFAQSEKYTKAMQDKVMASDTTFNATALADLSAAFERIADAEKTQWLPYYYAALTQTNAGYMLYTEGQRTGNTDGMAKVDPMAERAELLLNKAEALSANNSEIYAVRKMIATMRMMVDPMNRYMTYGPKAQQALETAKKLNPENPRVYYLEGVDKFQTPEQYGGSKTEAKKLFELALKKFETFKPVSALEPNWGKVNTQYFLSQIK